MRALPSFCLQTLQQQQQVPPKGLHFNLVRTGQISKILKSSQMSLVGSTESPFATGHSLSGWIYLFLVFNGIIPCNPIYTAISSKRERRLQSSQRLFCKEGARIINPTESQSDSVAHCWALACWTLTLSVSCFLV